MCLGCSASAGSVSLSSHSESNVDVRHEARAEASMGMENTDDERMRSWPSPTVILQADFTSQSTHSAIKLPHWTGLACRRWHFHIVTAGFPRVQRNSCSHSLTMRTGVRFILKLGRTLSVWGLLSGNMRTYLGLTDNLSCVCIHMLRHSLELSMTGSAVAGTQRL